jgi:hypothetical protein
LRFFKIFVLIALALAQAARAATDSWTNIGGGTYSTVTNWSTGAVPKSSDLASFALNDAYTVNFTANATANQLLVDTGQVTFNLGGKTASFTSGSTGNPFEGLAVAQTLGNTATLTLNDGTVTASYASVGAANQNMMGGNGTLNLPAGAKLTMHDGSTDEDKLTVGNDATGTFNVTGGQATLDDLSIANGASSGTTSVGTVNVTGSGASITVNESLSLADHTGGTATLIVQNSGLVTTNQLYVGSDGGTGTLTVDAATVNAHFLVAGSASRGTITLQDGARVNAVNNFLGTGAIAIGYYSGSNGLLTIKGGSTLSDVGNLTIGVTSPLNPGDNSTAELQVIGGGNTIQISGNLDMGPSAPSIADVIDPTGISLISVAGSASLTGNLDVELSDVTPYAGETYTLLTAAGGITGSLTLVGPDAADFRISKAGDSLEAIYSPVPEPAGTAVMLAVMMGAARRRTAKPTPLSMK